MFLKQTNFRLNYRKFKKRGAVAKTFFWGLIIIAILAGSGYGIWKYFSSGSSQKSNVIFATVTRGTFLHEVNGKGTAESAQNVEIASKVEGSATIIWIIDEGETVNENDELVILDSSSIEDKLSSQQNTYSSSLAEVASAQATLRTAELSLEEYIEGTFESELTSAENKIYSATETKKQKADSVRFTERLLKANYTTNTQLEVDQVSFQQAINDLKTSELSWIVLMKYSSEKKITELMSSIETARASLDAKIYRNQIDKERLDYYGEQFEACTIRAPQEGQVVYANQDSRRWMSESDMIREGATVRERQVLIRLPDPTQMQVKALINESNIAAVKKNMKAIIAFDAIPNKTFNGTITSVSQYPEISWMSSSKDYQTIVKIEDSSNQIRAGLTAEVRVIADQQFDVLMLPVQSIIEVGKKTYCLQYSPNGEWTYKEVLIGASNAKQVIILDGLEENDVVVSGARLYKDKVEFPLDDEPSDFEDSPIYQAKIEAAKKEKELLESAKLIPADQNFDGMPGGTDGASPGQGMPGGTDGASPGQGMPQDGPIPQDIAVKPDQETEISKNSKEEIEKEKDKEKLLQIEKISNYFDQTSMELCYNLDINSDKYISKWEMYWIAPEILEFFNDWDRNTADKPSSSVFVVPKMIVQSIVDKYYGDKPEKGQSILDSFEKLNKNMNIGSENDAAFPLEAALLEGMAQKAPEMKETLIAFENKLKDEQTQNTEGAPSVLAALKQKAPELYSMIDSWIDNYNKDKVNYMISFDEIGNDNQDLLDFVQEWNQVLTKTDLVIGFCTVRNFYQRFKRISDLESNQEEEQEEQTGINGLFNTDSNELFSKLDTNKNGFLTDDEISSLPNADKIKQLTSHFDTNSDEKISKEELSNGLKNLKRMLGNSGMTTDNRGNQGGSPPPPPH
ncbi:MAG: HlyD family efflux transporter periplasmic adaptor subunit [Planctomycetia bacterium]|nr:HlyD family efflux transporter periplasmic adaptor subunit [Planctomycetia bacterium]